jgi:two-component system response regulator MprA
MPPGSDGANQSVHPDSRGRTPDSCGKVGRPSPVSSVIWQHPSMAPGDDLSGVSVLIAEDDADLRDLLATTLRYQGAEVRVAANGVEAMAVLSNWQPHLIFCDLQMPEMDGWQFVRQVRADASLGRIPVIALSGRGSPTSLVQSMDAGFDGHLVKPVGPDALQAQVRRFVRTSP